MTQTEMVLCIRRERLPLKWVLKRSVVPMTLDAFADACIRSGFVFMERRDAEIRPDFKQIIPYIVLQTDDREKTARYRRQGSEKRLHELWSVGIGGHINPSDIPGSFGTFHDILMAGMFRELKEEILERPDDDKPDFMGVISEEMTEVGSVHLGAVFRILTRSPEKYLAGPELSLFSWEKTRDLSRLHLELWSEMALELLSAGPAFKHLQNG